MSDLRKAYKQAGVDVEEGYKAVELMSESVKKTHSENVLKMLSNFGGIFDISKIVDSDIKDPVLVSGTDGVGTKLKIAFDTGIHNTVGIDLVAMCVNDILCHGAKPLFFLDYFASGKIKAEVVADVVSGVAKGCEMSGMSLIGGETAEMPSFYGEGEYDLAGFAVGIASKSKIIDGSDVKAGDVLIGLSSSGIHSNGYSLVRRILFEQNNYKLSDLLVDVANNSEDNKNIESDINRLKFDDIDDKITLGEALLTSTRIYVNAIMELMKSVKIHGMAHITGGGFYENIPRMLKDGLQANIDINSYDKPVIFDILQRDGNLSIDEMCHIFNMGMGFVIAVDEKDKDTSIKVLKKMGENPVELGNIVSGKTGVKIV